MGIAAGITCSVHFTILTVSHRADFASLPWLRSLITFQWPSVTYTLDILAWDVFFGISVFVLRRSSAGHGCPGRSGFSCSRAE